MGETVDFHGLTCPLGNEHVREWKANGRRVMGFFCSHAPEELLWAAGLLPLRMRGTGSEETTHADQYLGAVNCSFVRHTVSLVMDGRLDFLDAVLVTNSCDHIRRLADIFSAKGAVPFCYYLDLPHLDSNASRGRLSDSLRVLQRRLESDLGAQVSEERLRDAVKLYNRTRELLGRASRLRGENPPRISGSEVLAMSVAASSMPRDRFNPLLERRLAELENATPVAAQQPRLLILGGMLDDPAYLRVIEELGAHVVADQLCCGAKTFVCRTDEEGDPIDAIAKRMLRDLPCPRMIADYEKRVQSIAATVAEYRIDAIICERLKFCDLWASEVKMLHTSIREKIGVPFLALERDYLTPGGLGQMRTRVQAFLENLR